MTSHGANIGDQSNDTDSALVTVVTIFLNGGVYLAEAIESVLAQQYTNWELVLVDDGSTDGSTQVARSYAERFRDRIRYVEHPGHENRGMSASRNLGVRNGTGEYVSFLDADDVWLPEKLARHVPLLQRERDAGWLAGDLLLWYSWSGKHDDRSRDRVRRLNTTSDALLQPPRFFREIVQGGGATPGINSLLIRRTVFDAVGGSEEEFRGLYEDQVLLAKLALHAPVYIGSGCYDRYRQHPESHTAVLMRDGGYHPHHPHASRRPFLEWAERYVNARGPVDPSVQRAVAMALKPYRNRIAYFAEWARMAVTSLRWTGLATMQASLRRIVRSIMPLGLHAWISRRRYGPNYRPPPGRIDFGSLQRTVPISRGFGWDRGLPVDRYYIERALKAFASDIHGRVLEIGDDEYTRTFGESRVTRADILHVHAGNPKASFVGDLTDAPQIPTDSFDCVILTQTLHLIYDTRAAIRTIHRILKPGGVAIITVPGITQTSADEWKSQWMWSFTSHSFTRMMSETFPADNLTVQTYGNVFAAVALLHGVALHEVATAELDVHDDEYQLIVGVRAVKPRS